MVSVACVYSLRIGDSLYPIYYFCKHISGKKIKHVCSSRNIVSIFLGTSFLGDGSCFSVTFKKSEIITIFLTEKQGKSLALNLCD